MRAIRTERYLRRTRFLLWFFCATSTNGIIHDINNSVFRRRDVPNGEIPKANLLFYFVLSPSLSLPCFLRLFRIIFRLVELSSRYIQYLSGACPITCAPSYQMKIRQSPTQRKKALSRKIAPEKTRGWFVKN